MLIAHADRYFEVGQERAAPSVPAFRAERCQDAAKVSDGNRRELARVLKRVLREVDDLPEPLRAAIKAALD
jgi:hypothetical protein